MPKPRIILAVDRPGWAFHSIARQIVTHLSDNCEFRIALANEVRGECDILVAFWWNALPSLLNNVKFQKLVLCVYDHLSWNRSENDRHFFQQAIRRADVIACCNTKLMDELTSGGLDIGDTPMVLVEDGVDTGLFPQLPLPEQFRVGWCGNSAVGYGQVKGLNLLSEACEQAGVELSVLDFACCGGLPQWQMPSWYRHISVYLNASANDGTPNPPLEAMACGRPVISTKVGVMPGVVQHGYNGYLVDRTVSDLVAAIRQIQHRDLLPMSNAARATAETWDWGRKVKAWSGVFHAAAMPRKAPAVIKTRPRGLLVADVPGWAFDINEKDMAEYCTDFDFGHYFLIEKKPPPAMSKYSFAFLPYHRWYLDHYWDGVPILGSLRSQWFDPKQPDTVPKNDAAFIDKCHGFHVCYLGAYKGLAKQFQQVVYLTNPINMRRFKRCTELHSKIVVEWNGNAAHGQEDALADVKGIHHIIKPAVEAAGVELRTAEYNTCRLEPDEMNEFYLGSNVALCASKYEGASNSVMEAMASGLALIATDVGNHSEMRDSQIEHFGDTGILLVPRTVEAFQAALESLTPERVLAMGQINRLEIQQRWSWDAWRDRYTEFFRMAL